MEVSVHRSDECAQTGKPIDHPMVDAVKPAPSVLLQERIEGVVLLGVESGWDRLVQRNKVP